VKILEIDSERRRLSLSVKRVEDQVLPVRPIEPVSGDLDDMPELGLSEDVFAESARMDLAGDAESPGGDSVKGMDAPSSVEAADGGADIGAELAAGGETVEPAAVEAAEPAVAEVDAVEAPAAPEAAPAAEVEALEPTAPEPAAAAASSAPEPEPEPEPGATTAANGSDAELDDVDAPAVVSTSGPGEPTA